MPSSPQNSNRPIAGGTATFRRPSCEFDAGTRFPAPGFARASKPDVIAESWEPDLSTAMRRARGRLETTHICPLPDGRARVTHDLDLPVDENPRT